jgi:hypothetical protein
MGNPTPLIAKFVWPGYARNAMTFDVGANRLESAFESVLGVGTWVGVLVGETADGEA